LDYGEHIMTIIPGLKQSAHDAALSSGPGYEQLKDAPSSGQRARAIAAEPPGARKALAAEGFTGPMIDKALKSSSKR
jgi:hypothetical protein